MTAVEWLVDQLEEQINGQCFWNDKWHSIQKTIEYALELEKQQIIDAFETAFIEAYKKPIIGVETDNQGQYRNFNSAGQYYSETYKKPTE
jgi:membrane-bound lytic murein transglycosylase